MEKVSRSIFYKEKESIRFFLGKEDSLERDFLDKLSKRPFMQDLDNASVNILRLFNNACYICTLVYEEDYPLLELYEYEKIAIDGHHDPVWTNHMFPVTMALVVCWLSSDECRKILEKRGRLKDIEELCKGICMNIEEHNTISNDGIEDFRALISHEQRHPSAFIVESSFLRRPMEEVMEDSSVKGNEIFDSMKYFVDTLKNNPDEFLGAFGPDSYFIKQLPKISLSEKEIKSRLADWLDNKSDDTVEEPTGIEQAFNAHVGLPSFTSRQIAIIAYAFCKKGNVIPKNKKNIGPLFQRLTGHSANRIGQNLCSSYSDEEIEEIAAIVESDMPEFAKYLREKSFFLSDKEK